MTIVVDSNVALKWILDEEGSVEARSLLSTEALAAPDLLFVECANVLWTKTRRGVLKRDEAVEGMAIIEGAAIRSIPGRPYVAMAQKISLDLQQSAYDSLYLAVAMSERMIFVTADDRFSRAALDHPIYARSVRSLT